MDDRTYAEMKRETNRWCSYGIPTFFKCPWDENPANAEIALVDVPHSSGNDFHRIVYAESVRAARGAYSAFERKWMPHCPSVVRSLQDGGEELLTFCQFPKRQWKTLRTTSVIERMNEEFRRRAKTQGRCYRGRSVGPALRPRGHRQIRLRRLDGWRQIPASLRLRREAAA